MNEKISALIDGEASFSESDKLVDQLLASSKNARDWERYQLIGAVMRNELDPVSDRLASVDVVDRVHTQLAAEPTVLAPAAMPKRAAGSETLQRGKSWMAAGALALAASVAALAVITFNPRTAPDKALPVAATGDAPAVVASVAPASMEMEAEMMELLVGHGEFSAASGLNGLVAYAKFVSDSSMNH